MKKLNRLLSVFLCISLLATLFSSLSFIASADNSIIPTELVENGNFSDGSTTLSSQWAGVDSTLELTNNAKYIGTHCLKVTPNTSGGTAKAELTLTAKPDTMYLLNVMTSGGWNNFTYYINDKAVSFADTADGTVYTERSNTTAKTVQTSLFTTPADSSTVKITFERVGGIFELDHVYVSEYGVDKPIDEGFDNGIGRHYVANNDAATTNTIVTSTGNNYLEVKNNEASWKMGPHFYAATVPGQTYKVSYYLYTTSRWATMFIANGNMWGNSGTSFAISNAMTDSQCWKWIPISTTFTATSYFTTIGFKLSESLASFCVDSLVVSKVTDDTPTELVDNAEFTENRISTQWNTGTASSMAISTAKYLGNYCLNIKGDGSNWKDSYLKLDVKPNTKYSLNMLTKTTSGGQFQYYINNQAITINRVGNAATKKAGVSVTGNWVQETAWFETPADCTEIIITFNLKVTNTYIDRMSVTEMDTADAFDDGGFENGEIGNQLISNQKNIEVSSKYAKSGKYSLKIYDVEKSWEAQANLWVPVTPGKTYKVSYDALSPMGEWYTWCVDTDMWGISGGAATAELVTVGGKAAGKSWTPYSAEFTVPANIYRVAIGFKMDGKGKDGLYIDNLSVKEVVSVTATAQNGGEVTGGGGYTIGETAKLIASDYSGYDFAGWYEGDTLVSNEQIYSFKVTKAAAYTAHFIESTNLIANDSFETGDYNWNYNNNYGPYLWDATTNWNKVSVTDDAHNGNYAIKIVNNGDDKMAVLKQTVAVTPDTDYMLTFWVKFDSNTAKNTENDAYYKVNNTDIADIAVDTEWTQYVYSFNSGDKETAIIEFVSKYSDFVIDDISLTATTAGIIVNGDFENGSAIGWRGDIAADTTVANGQYSAKVNGTASYTCGTVANTVYMVTFKAYRADLANDFGLSILSGTGDALYTTATQLNNLDSGEFVTVKAVFKSAVDTAKIVIASNGDIWVDDFTIAEYEADGDANLDGEINLKDLVRMKKYAVELITNNKLAGDIDADGDVDSVDLSAFRGELIGNFTQAAQ